MATLPLGIRPHGPLVDLCVSCSHIVRIFKIYLIGIKILKTYDTNNYTEVYFSVYLLFYLLIHPLSAVFISEETECRTFVIENKSISFSIFN